MSPRAPIRWCLLIVGAIGCSTEGQTEGRTESKWLNLPAMLASRFDSSAPAGSLSLVGGGSWTADSAVELEISASDDVGVTEMCIAQNAWCARWVPFASRVDLNLNRGSGEVPIYLWLRDEAGNTSSAISTTVRYDQRAPANGTVSATVRAGGLDLTWAGYSDRDSGVASYVVHGRVGPAAPRCSDEGTRLWAGTSTSAGINLGPGDWSLRVCALDRVGNRSTGTIVRGTPSSDGSPPTVGGFHLDAGATYTGDREVELTITVSDPSGVARYCVSEDPGSCVAWLDWGGSATHSLSPGDGEKQVYAWFRDAYGVETPSPANDSIQLDRTPPEDGALTLAGGAGGVLNMSWTAASDGGSGVSSYVVVYAEDRAPADCGSGTVAYRGAGLSASIAGLTGGEPYGVRVCALDGVGNLSGGTNARVTLLDEYSPPTLSSVTIDGGAPYSIDRTVSVRLVASDASGIGRMCVSTSGVCSSWQAYDDEFNYTLPAAYGTHRVNVWLEDELGNQMSSPGWAEIEYGADVDGDGVIASYDCDDNDARKRPGLTETCDLLDNDCDGTTDESASDALVFWVDADRDGFGDPARTSLACRLTSGLSASSDDCDDGDGLVYPDAVEYCDGSDSDCDGEDGAVDLTCGGRVAAADRFNGSVMVLDAWSGALMQSVTTGTHMTGITYDYDGNLWASAYGVNQIYKISPNGTVLATLPMTYTTIGLSLDPDTGNILAVDYGGRVLSLHPTTFAATVLATGLNQPWYALRFPGDETLWVAERGTQNVVSILGGVRQRSVYVPGLYLLGTKDNGSLWAGGSNGLSEVDRQTGAVVLDSTAYHLGLAPHPEPGSLAYTTHNSGYTVRWSDGTRQLISSSFSTGWGLASDLPMDGDNDGYESVAWGGPDCDDTDGSIYPGDGTCPAGRSCKEALYWNPSISSGSTLVDPDGIDRGVAPFTVVCDQSTSGGGWTRIDYAADLAFQQWGSGGDRLQTPAPEFRFLLSDAQITALQAVSTEGRQTYVGLCNGVIHYYYQHGVSYYYTLGFQYFDRSISTRGAASYSPDNITVLADGCKGNGGEGGSLANATVFDIRSPKVPIRNVSCVDCGDGGEKFGSPLTANPAWLR